MAKTHLANPIVHSVVAAIGAILLFALVLGGMLESNVRGPVFWVILFPFALMPVYVIVTVWKRRPERQGFIFDHRANEFMKDGTRVSALQDIDHIEVLKSADCSGDWYICSAVLKDQRPFELEAVGDPTRQEQEQVEQLAMEVAEFIGCEVRQGEDPWPRKHEC